MPPNAHSRAKSRFSRGVFAKKIPFDKRNRKGRALISVGARHRIFKFNPLYFADFFQMKLKPLGKITLFLLLAGAAFGAWKVLGPRFAPQVAATPSSNGFPPNTSPSDFAPAQRTTSEIQLVTSASRKGWMLDQIEKFNASRPKGTPIRAKYVETREGMHAILGGKLQPTLYAPSSVIWADRLASAYDQKTGHTLLDTSDDASFRVLLKTPMVFLTTREKARVLRPLLGTNAAWSNIRAISSGQKSVPWGRLKWAHADPLSANSGMMALAMIVADYTDRTNQGGAMSAAVDSAAFAGYLKSLYARFVADSAVKKGSTALAQSFASEPSRYDFIVAYESVALGLVRENPDLAVIYPTPTVNAENSIALLNWPNTNAQNLQIGREFMQFIASPQALSEAKSEYFRPVRGAGIQSELQKYGANGFKNSYSAIEVPPYEVLNKVAFGWKTLVARS